LRGGVPPIFVAADGEAYWLVDAERRAMDSRLAAEYAGLQVSMRGSKLRRADLMFFAFDAGSLARE
jgi:hypothetical protein